MRPGVVVNIVDSAPPAGAPTGTGTAFWIGTAAMGAVGAVKVLSSTMAQQFHGMPAVGGALVDQITAFFLEGGAGLYVSRIVSASADGAEADLPGATGAGVTLTLSPGVFGNAWKASCKADTTDATARVVTVFDDLADMMDQGPAFKAKADLLAWGDSSLYVTVIDNDTASAELPTTTPTNVSFSGGDDGPALAPTDYDEALSYFDARAWSRSGRCSRTWHSQHDRGDQQHDLCPCLTSTTESPSLDVADGDVPATEATYAAAMRTATPNDARRSGVWGPWANCMLYSGSAARPVAWSAIEMRHHRTQRKDWQPASRRAKRHLSNCDLPTRAQRVAWAAARSPDGTGRQRLHADLQRGRELRLEDMLLEPAWLSMNAPRTVMKVQAQAEAIGEQRSACADRRQGPGNRSPCRRPQRHAAEFLHTGPAVRQHAQRCVPRGRGPVRQHSAGACEQRASRNDFAAMSRRSQSSWKWTSSSSALTRLSLPKRR